MILVVDNYDSFTYNLVHAVHKSGEAVQVIRNDAIDRAGVVALAPDGIILSPGPGHPGVQRDFGVCTDLIKEPLRVPILGVCLGMQGMAHHLGGSVAAAPDIVHGEASRITLRPHALWEGLPEAIDVGRYHSLSVHSMPPDFDELAISDDGILMAMGHRKEPWMGVQFHPESVLSPQGQRIVDNFVEMCR